MAGCLYLTLHHCNVRLVLFDLRSSSSLQEYSMKASTALASFVSCGSCHKYDIYSHLGERIYIVNNYTYLSKTHQNSSDSALFTPPEIP